MADGPNTIEVSLLGRTYRVACEEGERESLLQAVAYLDSKMNEIRKAGKVMGAERIAVMAALNVAHELLGMRLGAGFDVGKAKTPHQRDRVEARRCHCKAGGLVLKRSCSLR
jgi:cell division protein ZapA